MSASVDTPDSSAHLTVDTSPTTTTTATPPTTNSNSSSAPAQSTSPAPMMTGLPTEEISPRWDDSSSPEKDAKKESPLLWVGIARGSTLLAQMSTCEDNTKILKASQRFLQKEPTTGWDFRSYTINSERRSVQAVKFHVFERARIPVGARAKLRGLTVHTFLNGAGVRILEYYPDTDKYHIRPTVPLGETSTLTKTLHVKAEHLMSGENDVRVWTFACLFDGKRMSEKAVCLFIQKIALLAEAFRRTKEWQEGKELSCQEQMKPIIESLMQQFEEPHVIATMDDSLEFCKHVIAQNVKIGSWGSI